MSAPKIYQRLKTTVVTKPTIEPLSLHEVKKHLEISASEDAHDEQLAMLLHAASEQWEHDTDSSLMLQTRKLLVTDFVDELMLPLGPIQSIVHVKYYDTGNTLRTLANTVYTFDSDYGYLRLKYGQEWPSVCDRFDAVEVQYTCGYTLQTDVPIIAKQALLLLCGYYFENRGDADKPNSMTAYERLVLRYMRKTYP